MEIKLFMANIANGQHHGLSDWQSLLLYPVKMPDYTTPLMWTKVILDVVYDQKLLNKRAVQERCHYMRDMIIQD